MNGSEIATELGITRQAVYNILKRALKNYYKEFQKQNKDLSPFDVICVMMKMLNVPNNEKEIIKYFNLFPYDIKHEVTHYLVKNSKKLSSGRTMFPLMQQVF
jgi:predicted DNA-binding protein YlxM (UPF0122 family)